MSATPQRSLSSWIPGAGLALLIGLAPPVGAQTAQWTYLGLGGHEVRSIKVVDPYLFAATETGVFRWTLGSPDTLWTPLGPDTLDAGALLFLDASTLLAGGVDPSGQKLYRSADQGQTWSVVSMPRPYWYIEDLQIHPLSPDTLYASDGGAILRSGDSGQTWLAVTSFTNQWRTIAVSPITPGRVWGGGENF